MEGDDQQSGEFYRNQRAHYRIHEDLLKDYTVMEKFNSILRLNPTVIRDKTILDVGAGTGIFSMMAARAGAKHVYTWEPTSIALYAEEAIKKNDLSDKITVLTGEIESLDLPEKVDIVFTSSFGYACIFESVFPQFIYAQKNFLKDDGITMPHEVCSYIAAYGKSDLPPRPSFWDAVYGFDYSPMKTPNSKEPGIVEIDTGRLITETNVFSQIITKGTDPKDFKISGDFELEVLEEQTLEGIAFWFCLDYKGGAHDISISTSPFANETHWMQIAFPLNNQPAVETGDMIYGKLSIVPNNSNCRPLDFILSYHVNDGETYEQKASFR